MRTALAFAVLTLLQAPHALAQSDLPACDGSYAIVRVSTIKPGEIQTFMQAIAAHKAWYRGHGYSDNIIVSSRIVERGEHGTPPKYSDTQVMTFHINPPTEVQHDAAWDAYVKLYRDSSDVVQEYQICMPKLVP